MRVAPAPLVVLALGAQGTDPPSVVPMPIQINLEPFFQQVERMTPRVPPGVETWTDLPGGLRGATAYRFNLYRDPLSLSLHGNRMMVRTTAHYWFEVGLRAGSFVKGVGSCGQGAEGFRRTLITCRGEVGVTPHWGLEVRLFPAQVDALNPCEITLAGFDITGKLLGGMNESLSKALSSLEQQLRAQTFLRERAALVWQQVQRPVEVAPGIHLALNPERLRLGPWRSERKVLTIPLEVHARPQLVMGEAPPEGHLPLPALEPMAGAGAGAFQLRVTADFPFVEASRQLRAQLAGKRFDTDKGSFEVVDVAVHGDGAAAVLELELRGRVNGRLALAGRPVCDPFTGVLRLEGLDYTLASRSWITKVGEWLFRSTLRKTLQEKANFLVNQKFQELRTQVGQGLNRSVAPGIGLSGSLDDLLLGQPRILQDRFQVEAFLRGQVMVRVDGI